MTAPVTRSGLKRRRPGVKAIKYLFFSRHAILGTDEAHGATRGNAAHQKGTNEGYQEAVVAYQVDSALRIRDVSNPHSSGSPE
eukprot:3941283-Rhodomonas_salina.1